MKVQMTIKVFLTSCLFLLMACSREEDVQTPSDDILINQIGYVSSSSKYALLRIKSDNFQIKTSEGKVVFEGETGPPEYWELSGDSVQLADFSDFTTPGTYVLCVGDSVSYPFKIADRLYGELADAVLKSYYYARCGVDLEERYAGKWHRKAGHPDTSVVVHVSAVDAYRPKGTIIASSGGWYDAGDFGKYVVNSGISTYTLLLSSRLNKEYHQAQNLNIPESNNELPDILDETLVNLKWMLTMQDPNDGGVYHKLTTKNFVGFVMPSETSDQRYVVQKTTAATLDFAATMAYASRVLSTYSLNELANETAASAEKAWQWALRHPDMVYEQPGDISTGAYGDNNLEDEWFWAAVEMYLLTENDQCLQKVQNAIQQPGTPTWRRVNTLGVISLLTSEKRRDFSNIEQDFLSYADLLLTKEEESPYIVSIDHFAWGSNSDVANEGMLKLIAFRLTGDEKYLASARNDLDYILGRNATGYSFVTGFGSKSPMHPHQRISSADGVEAPMPGYLVGGPNTNVFTDCDPDKVQRSRFPASSYVDEECSYSTNETAINWNAPLVFLVSALDGIDR
ncbi:glycoside hydrolase family 9 protein [Maribellus sp. YY47]|uniref:glycoside hydrolase family 9 protein n=1 Tax=Maribellus sp. YY47 TaxID=2929486 RepID=UPI0020010679|nr:glycoside hydrolase family 9 protein [Maribellus sp. YY47]MCK3683921.1 glycoside hydrolase family 9 protein [Maribellus sp. YY47]